MNISKISTPPHGAINDDYVLVTDRYCVVLDGATANGMPTGCIHDVPWYVEQLATGIANELDRSSTLPLREALRGGIQHACRAHAVTCDLGVPDSPSSTVALTRVAGGNIDYLVLSDSPVILQDHSGDITVVLDERGDNVPAPDRETISRYRNTDDGFWVASTRPDAADRALVGSKPVQDVRRFALLTDGTTRLIDYFGWSWNQLLDHMEDQGLPATVDVIRQLELRAAGTDFAVKTHDDASAVLVIP